MQPSNTSTSFPAACPIIIVLCVSLQNTGTLPVLRRFVFPPGSKHAPS
jgi:hypothetical protein